MQVPEGNNHDFKRTTVEQLEFFVAFITDHPQVLANKNDPTDPNRIKNFWCELAETLNALNGPVRSVAKWKETLSHWKNQLRSRARKAKVSAIATGGGPPAKIKFKDFEERALQAFGNIAVDGLPGVNTLGYEPTSVVILPTPSQTSDQNDYEDTEYLESPFLSPSLSAADTQNNLSQSSSVIVAPSSSTSSVIVAPSSAQDKKTHKSSSTSFELMKELLEITKAREERDKALQKENMRIQQSLAESLKSLADSVKSLSAAIAKSS